MKNGSSSGISALFPHLIRVRVNMRRETDAIPQILYKSLTFLARRLFSRRLSSFGRAAVLLAGLNTIATLTAQQPDVDPPAPLVLAAEPASLPSAPDADSQQAASAQSSGTDESASQQPVPQNAEDDSGGKQTKRILGIIPNFRAVSANTKLPPETVKEKFIDATEDSFDYSAIFIPAVIAAYNMHEQTTPEFHQGAAGYARYFWHSAVDQTSENYMVEFIFPTVTHEDARYYTLGHGGFVKRTGYALSRAIITRSNSGADVFNISEVFGAGAAAGISNLYYPSASRSVGNTMSEWAEDVGIDAASFWFKEFWPDINRHVFHNKYSNAPAQK
jgi:hypothetical protein